MPNGVANPISNENGTDATSIVPPTPVPSPPLVSFSPAQIASLRCQIFAFKLLSKNLPLPPPIQAAVFNPLAALRLVQVQDNEQQQLNASGAPSLIATPVVAETALPKEGSSALPPPPPGPTTVTVPTATVTENQPVASTSTAETASIVSTAMAIDEEIDDPIETPETSSSYPYNAFTHPLALLRGASVGSAPGAAPPTAALLRSRSLLVPTLLPRGLEPYTIREERNRFIDARIAQRIRELEKLPALLPDGIPNVHVNGRPRSLPSLSAPKLKALIELKSLNLLNRQKSLRDDVIRGFGQATHLSLVTDRNTFRRPRKQTLRDARLTESLERNQKMERERKSRQKHLDRIQSVTSHGQDLNYAQLSHSSVCQRLGKAVLKYHGEAEKEEAKRLERMSKERLRALKADDEEAYLKLIDKTKDTRITHLIRQTDSYLDSLSAAVAEQQKDAAVIDPMATDSAVEDDAPVDEGAFGAAPVFADEQKDKVDYYNVAHRIKESVSKQPEMLSGGELKEYQIKGLQWMISLYNNRLNGILADEMVGRHGLKAAPRMIANRALHIPQGLGKTIQTIALLTYLIEHKKQNGPFLVIVPLSTMTNWVLEFNRWAPTLVHVAYKGSPNARRTLQMTSLRPNSFHVLLTTYEYIIKDRPFLSKTKWTHMGE